jgi:succinyl-CoA synthetase beta subunit
MNESITEKKWWKRNWMWFVPFTAVALLSIIFFFSSESGNITAIAQAYADAPLFENALKKIRKNERVIQLLGNLEPIDKLAIIEGVVDYSDDNHSVNISVRLKGTKAKGKMDISADRTKGIWKYKKISVRIKEPKETILILTSTD